MIQLLIIADDPLVRSGLAAILNGSEQFEINGQTDVEGVRAAVEIYRPDFLLWDIGEEWEIQLPELEDEGIPMIGLLPNQFDGIERLGTLAGLLKRGVELIQIEAAIAAINCGIHVVDPLYKVMPTSVALPADLQIEALTPREREVLYLLAEGMTNKGIGQALGVSPHTIKFHVTSILNKLNAQSRTEAVAIATRAGLLTI
ncbi:MAG: response regulator transcription factor [Chloroflexota bacterium]